MVKTNFSSGNIKNKSDFYIEYVPSKSGKINLDIKSKTIILHGAKLKKTILNTLNDLEVNRFAFLLLFVPIVNILFELYLFFMPGKKDK